MEEIWKDIKDYEGLYQVSNLGRVRKLLPTKTILLKLRLEKYVRVSLRKNGIRKRFSVHRLVAISFIPNPHNKPCVNHKDCNTSHNNVDNLEWCTYKENTAYAIKLGRMHYEKLIAKALLHIESTKKKIIVLKNNQVIKQYDSMKQASKILNKDHKVIERWIKKKLEINGCYYCYANEYFKE